MRLSRCGRPHTRWAPGSALAIVVASKHTVVLAVSVNPGKRRKPGAFAGGCMHDAVKTIARGTPDVFGVFVVTIARVLFYFAREAADALSIRRSARPL